MNTRVNRKDFLKLSAAFGSALMMPSALRAQTFSNAVNAVSYSRPAVLPTVIHIFLYGGASELGGNFSNRAEIFDGSVNAYPGAQVSVTANGFWEQAGGAIMEDLLSAGDMSIFRTIHRRKDDTKAHGRSITQNLVGNTDIDAPGIATTLAAVLERFGAVDPGNDLFPFVSLEGESEVFTSGELKLSDSLRPVALGSNFSNPYEQKKNGLISDASANRLEDLANEVSGLQRLLWPLYRDFARAGDFFARRRGIKEFVDNIRNMPLPAGVTYPANNPMADRLRAAVNVAVHNPGTRFISVGNGGIGGWDAHSGAIETYTTNMNRVMQAVQAAVNHMKASGADDRVLINVYGDFGRNVNLNGSRGWDHGNNQNLYTFGGKSFRSLGRIVGETKLIGSASNNRLFTAPKDGSVEFEPFAIASTVFRHFGVQNPEVLTGEASID